MRKTVLSLVFIAVALLVASCEPYSEQVVRGTLYADSTKTSPIAGDTLIFRESTDGIGPYASSTYLGYAVTDAQGRWGFQYIRGFQNPYIQESSNAKMSFVEYFLLIIRGNDTLFWDYVGTFSSGNGDTLDLWPGKWQRPDWWYPEPDTTSTVDTNAIIDSLKWRGGLL